MPRDPAEREARAAARGEAEAARVKARIKELVDRAPPLTPEQITKLRALFSAANRAR